MPHKTRNLLMRQRITLINALQDYLSAYGIVSVLGLVVSTH